MKTLEDFFKDIDVSEQLSTSFENTESISDLCEKAQKYGYNFTENELEECYLAAVSGGLLDTDKSSYNGKLNQRVKGNNNVQVNYGDVTVSGGNVSKEPSTPLNATQKMQLVYWALNRKN